MSPSASPALVSLLFLSLCAACDAGPQFAPNPRPTPRDAGSRDAARPDASTACARPEEGCACAPSEGPLDCFLEPAASDDGVHCRAGTQYCRDGQWTACESVYEYELGGATAALLSGPTACNPCDPRCFGYVDRPGASEAASSSGLTYDSGRGGLTLPLSTPITPTLPDSDGDGVPDIADRCVGPGAFADASGGCYGDIFFYHALPFGGSSTIDPLDIRIQIRTADVYFLMDTTGSMGGELARLQTDLTTGNFHPTDATCGNGVVGAIRCAIPDAWFGVGYFDDYPVNPFGVAGVDLVYRNVRDITESLSVVQAGISSLSIHNGNDGPEGNTQALWAIATGRALGPYLSARTGCPAGTWGYPCFRDGTIPIVIHVTDAPFHNGPSSAYPYTHSWGTIATSGNDNLANATAVGTAGMWAEYSGSTASLVNDMSNPGCGSTTSPDAMFTFSVGGSSAQEVILSTAGSSFDTVLTLYRSESTASGAVPSTNETFLTARALIGTGPQRWTGNTSTMANDSGDTRCGSSGARDAVFSFILPAAATVRIDTSGSAYDTVLTLWRLGVPTPTYVSCNDDGAGLGSQSLIQTNLTAGTYYVAVDGYGSASGAYTLNFRTSATVAIPLACNDNAPSLTTSEIVQTLDPGDYIAVVEGRATASGAYKFGIGTARRASTDVLSPIVWSDATAALSARGVRTITLQTCGDWTNWYCLEGETHANSLASATSSVDGTGSPYVFRGAANGTGLSSAIVNAVVSLANYSRMDLSARAVGDVNGFTQLPISAVSWGPRGSCTSISGGTTFLGCLPGTEVAFNVAFRNTSVMPSVLPQVFDFFIEVVGNGTVVLERVPVRIVVPPMVSTYPASGSYLRDYDSGARCALNERPIWGTMRWDVPELPTGTSVRFEVRSADTAAALPTATPMATVTVPSAGTGSVDLTNLLATAGARARQYRLRVNAVLNASSDRLRAPVLREIQVGYTCLPDE